MGSLMKLGLLLVLYAFAPLVASAHDSPCHIDVEKRIVVGRQPTANVLYAHIKHVEMGSWPNGFWDETFTYIGDAQATSGKTYRIAYLRTIWGNSCRATNRLFIFDGDNKYLGQYYGIMVDPMDIRITGAQVTFPFDANDGNSFSLENGPPDTVWLDGDNPEWTAAQSSGKH